MFTFSALIYDGYKQQLVTGDYEDKTQFDAFLNAKFGVHLNLTKTMYAPDVSAPSRKLPTGRITAHSKNKTSSPA